MIVFFSPFRYLYLRNERGSLLLFRDLFAVVLLSVFFALPFFVFDQVNFAKPSGFVDRMGSLSSVLAGFYIAALIAVGSFVSSIGDLDKEIENGKIFNGRNKENSLTRREYICAIFGFLSFLALFLSVISSLVIISAAPIASAIKSVNFAVSGYSFNLLGVVGCVSVFLYSVVVSLMLITTFHGLYYLTDRIYAKSPQILPKNDGG